MSFPIKEFLIDEGAKILECLKEHFENTEDNRCVLCKKMFISKANNEMSFDFKIVENSSEFEWFKKGVYPRSKEHKIEYDFYIVERYQYNALKNRSIKGNDE